MTCLATVAVVSQGVYRADQRKGGGSPAPSADEKTSLCHPSNDSYNGSPGEMGSVAMRSLKLSLAAHGHAACAVTVCRVCPRTAHHDQPSVIHQDEIGVRTRRKKVLRKKTADSSTTRILVLKKVKCFTRPCLLLLFYPLDIEEENAQAIIVLLSPQPRWSCLGVTAS